MSSASISDAKGLPNITQQQFLTAQNRVLTQQASVQKAVLAYLLPQQKCDADRAKVKEVVLNTTIDKLPLIPMNQIMAPPLARYFTQIRKEWCLDDRSYLDHLWAVDLFRKMDELSQLPSKTLTSKTVVEWKNDLAAISIRYSHIFTQLHLEMAIRKESIITPVAGQDPVTLSDGSKGVLCHVSDRILFLRQNSQNIIDLRNKIDICYKKALECKRKTVACLTSYVLNQKTRQEFETIKLNESRVCEALQRVLEALDCGGSTWADPYAHRFFQEDRVGKFLPKSIQNRDLETNRQQLNWYFELIQTGWRIASERRWMTTVPNLLCSPLILPKLSEINGENVLALRRILVREIVLIFPKMTFIQTLLFTGQTVTWGEMRQQLGIPRSPGDKDESPVTATWLIDSSVCFFRAYHDLTTIRRHVEEVICKNLLPDFCTFDELCIRLFVHFSKVFVDKNSVEVKIENGFQGAIGRLFDQFESNLSRISNEFEKHTKAHLPAPMLLKAIVHQFSTMKEVLGNENYPPALEHTFRPFAPAVLFTANKVPSAIAKAKDKLFRSFEIALKAISSDQLSAERDLLIEKLEALSFIKLKGYLELFITLRDIHAVLLNPEQGTSAMEKGLHLIPSEFASLLQPKEIALLIDAQINRAFTANEVISDEKELISEFGQFLEASDDEQKSQELPLLQHTTDPIALEIIQDLKEQDTFKVAKGEKTRKIVRRLYRLGVFTQRFEGGSHRILAHTRTGQTFSLPMHEEQSLGVAGKLEEWVNGQILKN
jgi:predicted RNA binding protein YcfA (HicA-like mRNA interferase family)